MDKLLEFPLSAEDMPNLEELPEELQYLADCIGVSNVFKLIYYRASSYIYIPKTAYLRKWLKRLALKYHGKKRLKQLAAELKCSEQHLKRLLEEG